MLPLWRLQLEGLLELRLGTGALRTQCSTGLGARLGVVRAGSARKRIIAGACHWSGGPRERPGSGLFREIPLDDPEASRFRFRVLQDQGLARGNALNQTLRSPGTAIEPVSWCPWSRLGRECVRKRETH